MRPGAVPARARRADGVGRRPALGFVNPAHFSRAFRAAYGVSPREWRALRAADGA
ncbi:AraC family transcriptional regulator [Kitasatospora aburaviensis]